jgi:hypothetical protein
MPVEFASPWNDEKAQTKTHFLAPVGAETAWVGTRGVSRNEMDHLQDTVLIIEAANRAVVWTEPVDITMAELITPTSAGRSIGIEPFPCGVIMALIPDCSVLTLPSDINATTLSELLRRRGNKHGVR